MKTALVLGAGGFIGSHLVKRLKSEGYFVYGADLKYPEFSETQADEFKIVDLRNPIMCESLFGIFKWDEVYQLAADMGGAEFVFTGENDADLMTNSALINLNIAPLCVKYQVGKIFYSSSACMYPQEIQDSPNNLGLKESDAYPANPDSEYGWEKLFSERLYLAYAKNKGLDIRIARFHNIYGVEGTYQGGREKSPAAMCRKVAEQSKLDGFDLGYPPKRVIDVWGSGTQTRSFLYIDECVEGVRRLMESDYKLPMNIGSDEMVSINQLAQMVIDISGKNITIKNVYSTALGVKGRNSDNELIKQVLGWSPNYPLKKGLEKTYEWINQKVNG